MSYSLASSAEASRSEPSPIPPKPGSTSNQPAGASLYEVPCRPRTQPSPDLPEHPQPADDENEPVDRPATSRKSEPPGLSLKSEPDSTRKTTHRDTKSRPSYAQSQTEEALISAVHDYGDLPTYADVNNADESTLRRLAKELLFVAQQGRISASYHKLQDSLHSLANDTRAKTEDEDEVVAGQPGTTPDQTDKCTGQTGPVADPSGTPFGHAFEHVAEVENTNTELRQALEEASQTLDQENERLELLVDENRRLKDRIRSNRVHFNIIMQEWKRPSISWTSPWGPVSKHMPPPSKRKLSYVEETPHDPISTILVADQMLSNEQREVPVTPPSNILGKFSSPAHRSGTSSMWRLSGDRFREGEQTMRDEEGYVERDSYDSDATLLASDVEESDNGENGQGYPRAIDILNPPMQSPISPDEVRPIERHLPSTGLRQQRLFGQVQKPTTAAQTTHSTWRSAKRSKIGVEQSIER